MKLGDFFSQKWQDFRNADAETIFGKIDDGMEAGYQFVIGAVMDFVSPDFKPLERSGPKELVGIKAWGADDIKAAQEEGKRNRSEALQTARTEALQAFAGEAGGRIVECPREAEAIAKGNIPTAEGHEKVVSKGFSKAQMS
jgi:hypothetical protein